MPAPGPVPPPPPGRAAPRASRLLEAAPTAVAREMRPVLAPRETPIAAPGRFPADANAVPSQDPLGPGDGTAGSLFHFAQIRRTSCPTSPAQHCWCAFWL